MSETNEKKKITLKEWVLIAVSVILVIALIIGFVYDRDSALIERTNPFVISEEMDIQQVDKHGMLFYRQAYEACIKIPASYMQDLAMLIGEAYDFGGEVMIYDDYMEISSDLLEGYTMVPTPVEGSYLWLASYKFDDGHEITYIMDEEGPDAAFLYIYYLR